MILQGFDAIVLNAASPTALNGAVKKACDAGIVVVSFDGIVTEPCAYRIAVDFKQLGEMQIDYFASRGLKGNLLEVRGLAGVFVDDEIHQGTLTASRGIRIQDRRLGPRQLDANRGPEGGRGHPVDAPAGHGRRHARRRRLWRRPGLQGCGTADAGDLPRQSPRRTGMVEGTARCQSLRDHVGVDRAGSSTFAFWVAQQVLSGAKVPKEMTLPISTVTQKTLDAALKSTEPGGVVNVEYSQKEVIDFIAKAK